jgi:outer membrane murein-binding lipoprotein Lpp
MPQWIIDWLNTITPGQAVFVIVVAVSLITALWKGWPIVRALVKLTDTLATLPEDVAFIKHELNANSGKTVKDIATRTEKAVNDLSGEVVSLRAEVSTLSGDVGHVRRQTAALKTSIARHNQRLTAHIIVSPEDHSPRGLAGVKPFKEGAQS